MKESIIEVLDKVATERYEYSAFLNLCSNRQRTVLEYVDMKYAISPKENG